MSVALVVPTCRPDSFRDFLDAWGRVRFWDTLVVVEDAPTRTGGLAPPGAIHVSHAEINMHLGQDSWIISRRDSACRCYGFLRAKNAADVIVTLDDDVRPVPGRDFLAGHLANLDRTPRWASSVPGFEARGLPYRNRGVLEVALSMGLWAGVPDQDAAHQLVAPLTDWTPPEGNWVLPAGMYHPICGMNLAFPAWATPLMYFPPMGEGQPYRRFDDIWMGIIARKVCDHLGYHMVAGRPWVRHERASDPLANLVKEAPGVAANETFWEAVDAVRLTARSPAACARELGEGLARDGDPYVARLGSALQAWSERAA